MSLAYGSSRVCAWRGIEVHARNGRTRPGDPDPCGRVIFWDGNSGSWLHVHMRADADHRAVFGTAVRESAVRHPKTPVTA